MEKVSPQSLTSGYNFNQNMEKVSLPQSMQNITFGYIRNQGMEKVNCASWPAARHFGFESTSA
jgi:hypothetical protein